MNDRSYVGRLREVLGTEKVIVPGVDAIILNENGAALLQERSDLLLWGLPGGTLEIDETVLEALAREVREETGLEVLEAELVGLYSGPNYDTVYPTGDVLQNFSAAFYVTKWSGVIHTKSAESLRLEFFPLDSTPPMVHWHREVLDDFRTWQGRVVVK